MKFEVNLSEQKAEHFLFTSGVEFKPYSDAWAEVVRKKESQPVTISSPCFLAEKPLDVRITLIRRKPQVHLAIEVADAAIGQKIQAHLTRYSFENDGAALTDREQKQLNAQITEILGHDKLSVGSPERHAILPRHIVESLIELGEKTVWFRKHNLYELFHPHNVAKADRTLVTAWLIKLFESIPDLIGQIGVRIWEFSDRNVAEDLIRLVQDRKFGDRRGILCLALVKTKHPRAAKVIAGVLGEKGMTRWALEALGNLKAAEFAEEARKFLHDPDADIRREARKTLKKLGFPVEKPSPPVHLIKNRHLLPKGLEEWSANLDIADLNPVLEAVAKHIDSGFGRPEIAEVNSVVEDMKHNQTKTFCFPIIVEGHKSEIGFVIFMDDVDSPDLEIHSNPGLIAKLDKVLSAILDP